MAKNGNRTQKKKSLPGILSGRVQFCLGVTVTTPDGNKSKDTISTNVRIVWVRLPLDTAGSDVAGITTTVGRRGGKYIAIGAKKWMTSGIFTDYCPATVRTGGPGANGISALIIPLNSSGVERRKIENSGVVVMLCASGLTFSQTSTMSGSGLPARASAWPESALKIPTGMLSAVNPLARNSSKTQ